MTTDKALMVWAGTVVLVSLTLAQYYGPAWYVLTLLIGVNLIQYPITGFCPMAKLLRKMGYKSCCCGKDCKCEGECDCKEGEKKSCCCKKEEKTEGKSCGCA